MFYLLIIQWGTNKKKIQNSIKWNEKEDNIPNVRTKINKQTTTKNVESNGE